MAQSAATKNQDSRVNEKKWTLPLMKAGWSVIPSIILERQAALGLDALDINIIVHLVQYWWEPDNFPHPSVPTMAKALQVTDRTIQRRIRALEAAKLIKRVERRKTPQGSMTNLYVFDGLIKAATPYALEKLEEIERAKTAKRERLSRKRPRLSLVSE
jgi:predicted transcriptional regulator